VGRKARVGDDTRLPTQCDGRLSRGAVVALGAGPVPAPVVDLRRGTEFATIDYSEEKPLLFIGETVRAIVDDGAITIDGHMALGGAGHQPVPATLRALLGSRIDALSPESRAVLRVASVVGMTFRENVVEEVMDERVDAARYERLAEAAMIVPLDASGGWSFCHPLIHDAAYAGLLAIDRQAPRLGPSGRSPVIVPRPATPHGPCRS